MSGQQPPRRRRIAGEPKPGEEQRKPARRVVRKPVARPGATPKPEKPAAKAPKVEKPAAPAPKPDRPTATAAKAETATPAREEKGRAPARPATATPVRPSSAKPAAPAGEKAVWDARLVAVTVVTALSLAFAVAMGTLGVRTWNQTRGVESAQNAAAEAAGAAVTTVFSYRFDRLPQHLSESKKLMTPAFAKKFESISPTLDELAPQRKIQVKAETRDAGAVPCVKDCAKDRATVLVFFDQARLADGSKTPTVFANRVTVEMRKIGDDWLVDDIKAL
ncbi:MAG: hypothetical protein PGN07_01575 [Aeromicrobium erythreum]